jgi:hypothetical protein
VIHVRDWQAANTDGVDEHVLETGDADSDPENERDDSRERALLANEAKSEPDVAANVLKSWRHPHVARSIAREGHTSDPSARATLCFGWIGSTFFELAFGHHAVELQFLLQLRFTDATVKQVAEPSHELPHGVAFDVDSVPG